jgi:uncharacterized protein YjbI with pentapeptide repeats
VISLYGGYRYGWKWTGLAKSADFDKRTLWDWLDLLIIPAVLAAGSVWFNRRQQERASTNEDQRSQDEVLQKYFDQIGELLLDQRQRLRTSKKDDEVRKVAQVQTLTALRRLGANRKGHLLEFLQESNLIQHPGANMPEWRRKIRCPDSFEQELPIITLKDADLNGISSPVADMEGARLSGAQLRNANLRGANLVGAWLDSAVMGHADLSNARLSGAHLSYASLNDAQLSRAQLTSAIAYYAKMESATLVGALLHYAEFKDANLRNTDLKGTHLDWARLDRADLTGARNVSWEQLAKCRTLKGATMPSGEKYEEWIETPEGQSWIKTYKFEDWLETKGSVTFEVQAHEDSPRFSVPVHVLDKLGIPHDGGGAVLHLRIWDAKSGQELFSGEKELKSGAEVYGRDHPSDVGYKIRAGQPIRIAVTKVRE